VYVGRAANGHFLLEVTHGFEPIGRARPLRPLPFQPPHLPRSWGAPAVRVAIHTLGTRGDVQPYLAFALGLKAAGHEVLIAAPSQFEAFIGSRGIKFAHLPGEFLTLMETPEAKAAMSGSAGFAAGFKLIKHFRPIGRKELTLEWAAARAFQPELIIYHPKAIGAPHIAEKLGCPAVLASPLPGFTPTRAFASPLVPFRSLGPLNGLTHRLMAGSGEAIFRSMVAEWRVSELGLKSRPVRPSRPAATLYCYSQHVMPAPTDWPDSVAITGYWFLDDDDDWTPDPRLSRFLGSGETPVYVGFGSMPGLDPVEMTVMIIEALAHAGRRGVLATGGGAIGGHVASTDHVHIIEGAPHDKLFPLMSACVHHGGAGTTAASLRAGKPTVICPFFGDQPFWGRRVAELGVGPRPISRKSLSARTLAEAIASATRDGAMRRQATALGARINAEDGVGRSIAFLERRKLLASPGAV
jgi:sterol 3beta-glucosyltransferase